MSRSDNVQGILGAIGPFREKWGAGTSTAEREFLCDNQRDLRQFRNGRFSPNLVTKRTSVSCRGIRKDIFEKKNHFKSNLPLKSEIESRSNRHLTQSRLQVTGCTAEIYCLLHLVVQVPGSFLDRSTFLYAVRLRSYGTSNLPNFRTLAYFPHTNPQNVPSGDQPIQPGVSTSQNDYDFSM